MVPRVSARQELKPAQQRAIVLLREGRERELTRGAYQEIFGVSRSQAAYDLAELVEAGMVERVGGGRSTRYVLVREPNSTRRHWTSERIRAELAEFCAGRRAWPSAREFKAAGRADLYVAASRYGGIGFWAAELALPRAVPRWENRSVARLRLSLSWATIGAVGGALAVGAAVVIVQGLPRGTGTPTAKRAASEPAAMPASAKSTGKSTKPRTRRPAKHAATVKAKVAHTSTRQPRPAVERASTQPTAVLAARTVSPPSPPAPSTTSASSAARSTATSSSTATGPTPLMAPRTGSGTPAPLPPPTP
jgi:DNA-binding transcriptional ArsR family regulator